MTPTEKDDLIAELRTSLAYAQLKKTLRDEFAMAALPRLIADYGGGTNAHVRIAYEYADAMMKERHK
jgi:hypothetical protein